MSWMKVKDASKHYGISIDALYKWIAKGKVKSKRNPLTGRDVYIDLGEVPTLDELKAGRYLSAKEIMQTYGVSRSALTLWAKKGIISTVKYPNRRTIGYLKEDFERIIRERGKRYV